MGISPVIATVILTGIMLTIISVAIYYSTSLIDLNRQTMEYQNAKDLLTYAATVLEQVAFGTGGSRYVRFSLTSTGVNFENQSMFLRIQIAPLGGMGGSSPPISIPLERISIRGGPLVTTVARLLYPETGSLDTELSKLVVGAGEPLVIVYENFSGASFSYLEPRRARIVYNGAFNVTEKSMGVDCDGDGQVTTLLKCKVNYFMIQVVQLVPGQVGGSGTIPVVFRNVGGEVYNYTFNSANVQVTASLVDVNNRVLSSQTLKTSAPPANFCVVVVKISKIQVSTG